MNKNQIRQLVKQEVEKFKKEQAKIDAAQKERLQQLAGMKKKMTADACKAQGMMTMRDFLELQNRLQASAKGNLHPARKNEEKLFQESHPDRYIVAYLPGGSLYMRNAPLPLHVCRDGHVPEGETESFRNPDLTRVVDGEKSAGGQVLVDQHSKQMY